MENTKQDILKTIIMQSVNVNTDIVDAAKYIMDNRYSILIPEDRLNVIFNNIPPMNKSVLFDFFKIIKEDNFKEFAFISTIDKNNIPNVLLYKHYNLDFNSLKRYYNKKINIVQNLPDIKDKILVNLLDFLNVKQDKILDISGLYKVINRSLCARSYDNFSDVWLSIDNVKFMTQTYSMILGSNISRLYNFNLQEQSILNIIFAYYFLNKCLIADKKDKFNLLSNFSFLGNKINILDTLNGIDEVTKGSNFTDTNELIKVAKELSPDRLNKLNLSAFMTIVRTFNYDNLVSIMSAEYPGYWLYNLFATISGDRNNVFFVSKRLGILKDIIMFCSNLIHDKSFLESLYTK